MTNEEIEVKAKELSVKYNCEVTPFMFISNDEQIVGYLKEPSRIDKMRAIDLAEFSKTQAGYHLLITSLIQEESDKRILSEKSEDDKIYLGALEFATKMAVVSIEQLKKK